MPISDWSSDVCSSDLPWHGRRRPEGWFGGEPVLGRAPLSLLDFFHAAPIEAGLWVAKAREMFGGPVALGGVSLGALVAETAAAARSEEHTSELQSLMRISYAVFCLKKKK